jgi:hypothetical protein
VKRQKLKKQKPMSAPHRRPAARRTRPDGASPASKGRERRQVERARARLVTALEKASAAGDDVVRVADAIAEAAVERRESGLVASMIESRVLVDLVELRRLFSARAAFSDVTPDRELVPYLHVPAALLDWLCVSFGLESSFEAGAIVEIPRVRAESFALAGSLPPGTGLVQVKVTSPGWKRRGKTVGKTSGEVICAHARGDYPDARNP